MSKKVTTISNTDSNLAFLLGEMHRGNEMKIFDWHKAVRLIKKYEMKNVSAGLAEDWFWTGGDILENGKPTEGNYTYLGSTWATPVLMCENEVYECWCLESECDWYTDTCWPKSALMLLEGEYDK